MGAFRYVALDQNGKKFKGIIDADNARSARLMLRQRKLAPLSVEEAGLLTSGTKEKRRNHPRSLDLILLSRQLSTLLEAGLPLEKALSTIAQQSTKPELKNLVISLRTRVAEGHSFASALDHFPMLFPKVYRATITVGEKTGYLGIVLSHLAGHYEKRKALRQKIILALLYPAILTIVSIGIVIFLMTAVMPNVIEVFIRNNYSLPLLTRILIAFSSFVTHYGLGALAIIVVGIIGLKALLTKARHRRRLHVFLLRLPMIRDFLLAIDMVQISSTLSLLTKSGVPLVESLNITTQVVTNISVKEKLENVCRLVSEGTSLQQALRQQECFSPFMLNMVAVGESSGQLENMLDRVASHEQNELEQRVRILVGLFEPLVVLVMGGIVLALVLAIMLPILNLNQLVN